MVKMAHYPPPPPPLQVHYTIVRELGRTLIPSLSSILERNDVKKLERLGTRLV